MCKFLYDIGRTMENESLLELKEIQSRTHGGSFIQVTILLKWKKNER